MSAPAPSFNRSAPTPLAAPLTAGAGELSALLDRTSELVCALGPTGRVTFANSAMLRALAAPREMVLGARLAAFVAPSHRHRFADAARRLMDGEPVENVELVLHRGDASRVVCRARGAAIVEQERFAGAHLVMEDVTAQTQAEAIRSRLATTLELTSDIVLIATTDDRLVFLNGAARRFLGITADTPVEKVSLAAHFPTDERARREDALATTLRDGFWEGETALLDARGEAVPVSVVLVAHPSTIPGRPAYFVSAVVRDLRERVRAEQLKNQLVATVSHELRTPLTAIRGSADLLHRKWAPALDERGQSLVAMLLRNTDRLIRLVNDLVDIQRIESGISVLEPASLDAASLVAEAAEVARAKADETEITVRAETEQVHAWVDAGRIVQVLTNLLANAVKFSPPRSSIVASARATPDGGWVEFSVRDEGRGIPADRLTAVFEPFVQVESSDARERGGVGLGLAICRAIVKQHGGRIWAESEVGVGSTFRFRVPRAR